MVLLAHKAKNSTSRSNTLSAEQRLRGTHESLGLTQFCFVCGGKGKLFGGSEFYVENGKLGRSDPAKTW